MREHNRGQRIHMILDIYYMKKANIENIKLALKDYGISGCIELLFKKIDANGSSGKQIIVIDCHILIQNVEDINF